VKITKLSLAAIAAMTITTGAMASGDASEWDFSGQAVVFTQTADGFGDESLYTKGTTYRAVGGQLRAVNKDLFSGIGAGFEISATRSDSDSSPANIKGRPGPGFYYFAGSAGETSGGFTQAYLTANIDKTAIKAGRQTLGKGISPFAFTEGWQMFKNTMDAVKVENTNLPDTKLVYAYITNSNLSITANLNRSSFNNIGNPTAGPFANGSDRGAVDGLHMITAQNKSLEGVTLTGTYYIAPNALANTPVGPGSGSNTINGETSIIWGDAKFKVANVGVSLQGGQVDPAAGTATSAFGAKVASKLGMVNASLAYSSIGEGTSRISNIATSIKSPLYTQMLLDNVGQYHSSPGSQFIKASGNANVGIGKLIVSYGTAANDYIASKDGYSEVDVMYKAKLAKNVTGFAAYGYTKADTRESNNFVRLWGRYAF